MTTLYTFGTQVLGGACIDLSGLDRLTEMRHPHRSREARDVFQQLERECVHKFQLRFGVRKGKK